MGLIMNSIKKIIKKFHFLYKLLKIIKNKLNRLTLIYPLFIKVNPPLVKFAKPYKVPNIITIELTYRCNMKCINCNRQCRQAPSNVDMSPEQIKKFINESIKTQIIWDKIYLCGDEPTLNINLFEIIELLRSYRKNYSSETKIILQTNGAGKFVNTVLSKIPDDIQIDNSSKIKNIYKFHPINLAPKDSILYKFCDFSLGCPQVTTCGLGLTPYGYYPCPIAGAIDRVFGFNLGAKELCILNESHNKIKKTICAYCGGFRLARLTNKEKISPSWQIALLNYKLKAPNLDIF